MQNLPEKKKRKTQWVQTERAAHEAWAALIRKSPLAAQVMHILTSQVGEQNAVVISQKVLADFVQGSERGVRDALNILRKDNWIETRQIGGRGTVNAYVINDRVAWLGKRDGIRYSLFTAQVIISEAEQPDKEQIGEQTPLRRIPGLYNGESQLPSGDGMPPPSEPTLPGMEHHLPARYHGNAPELDSE
ncbi:MAG: helix-turn-helix domain-containing protein [Wenzhouxiangella sp.]|nr:helix-turn-helix domain-containing protein [Wenzhouxiangella sp.]